MEYGQKNYLLIVNYHPSMLLLAMTNELKKSGIITMKPYGIPKNLNTKDLLRKSMEMAQSGGMDGGAYASCMDDMNQSDSINGTIFN